MSKPQMASIILVTLVLFGLAYWLGSRSGLEESQSKKSSTEKDQTYYCSMHPQIRMPHLARCPICDMDLIVLSDDGPDPGPRAIRLSKSAQKLAQVETVKVQRKAVESIVSLVGKIDFDETQLKMITAKVPGRLDRLYVNYTGVTVKKGDHLADIYSPSLYTAQTQLLEAVKALGRPETQKSAFLKKSAEETLTAVRKKLSLLGLTDQQIAEVEKKKTPSKHLLISSEVSGVVVEKLADEGDYVEEGSPIYKVANLSQLWVKLEAYESDLPWLRFGQEVTFKTEAFPGEIHKGKITFIDWVVDPKSHTIKARLNIDNSRGHLKPGMFVRAEARSVLTEGGRVADPALAGKWVSPMHSEIIKDKPGACDVCGMDLVPAEELFHVDDGSSPPPLVIPTSAPLITGKRAIVYIKKPKSDIFEGREVVLGPRAGDEYVVLSGLKEGEEVVSRGAFKIDSSLQINAKVSMMNQSHSENKDHSHHSIQRLTESPSVHQKMDSLLSVYIQIQEALAKDQFTEAQKAFSRLEPQVHSLKSESMSETAKGHWEKDSNSLIKISKLSQKAKDILQLREIFEDLSHVALTLEKRFGHTQGEWIQIHCPMAFNDKGARWFQKAGTIANPYFGAQMLKCGNKEGTFLPHKPTPTQRDSDSKTKETNDG